jgi:type II secretory pathway component GspD/PulD (secretin)
MPQSEEHPMKNRTALALLLLLLAPVALGAVKKKPPLTLEVAPVSGGLPLVTLTASDVPVAEIAAQLAKKLGTTIDVSAAAGSFRLTTDLDQQPLDLTLRELAPQAYLDGILTGRTGEIAIVRIHLLTAGESAPPLDELRKSTTETIMFSGHTEDPALDPLAGQLHVAFRNGLLRVFARRQELSVVVARMAETLDIPFELVGDSREMVDVSVTDASLEHVMSALTPSVNLYYRRNLATFVTTPVRLVVKEPPPPASPPS